MIEIRFSLRDDVTVEPCDEGTRLTSPQGTWMLRGDGLSSLHQPESAPVVQRLEKAGLLCRTLFTDRGPFARLVPTSEGYERSPHALPHLLRMSRFAHLRWEEGTAAIETPLRPARIILLDERAHLMCARLGHGALLDAISDPEIARPFVELLHDAGMLEPDAESTALWEFHDLLFHSRSRRGRHDYPCGGTFPFLGRRAPAPALKSPIGDLDPIRLELPVSHGVVAECMERRQSVRAYGDEPLTIRQLGEFLYRTARVREVRETREHGEVSSRVYPGAGALYELEIYLAVHTCRGLEAGLYHFRPLDHALVRMKTTHAGALLQEARTTAGLESDPQVLIILAARFERMMWKYRGISYALILKDVGVLFQSMYLVATDMGLAPCALGTGNSDLFAHITGFDYYDETSVGEFLLGSADAAHISSSP